MRHITTEERRTRFALRHHLVQPASDVGTVAADLVGLHSSDPATVYLTAHARVAGFSTEDLESALYEERSLVRMLGMRRTMFVVPRDLAAVMDAACTKTYVAAEKRRLAAMLTEQGIASDGAAWLDDVMKQTLAALTARGEATARELVADVPELATKLSFGGEKSWAGTVGVSTRVLMLLATAGRIVRARPRGSWVSSQYRWAMLEQWLKEGLATIDPVEARGDLLRRWLTTYGPGTLTDITWWTGWTVGKAREALETVGAAEVELDDGLGWVLPDDFDAPAPVGDWTALLPGLDPTVMGWKERDWYLGDHWAELFDRNGNAGPTVWWNGRIVGGWAQHANGEVVVELLESVPGPVASGIDAGAAGLTNWLGDRVVKVRFPVPLEKRLRGW